MNTISKNYFGAWRSIGARILAAAIIAIALAGCGGGGSSGATDEPPAAVLPAAGELSRGEFVALVSDYLGWYHPSDYNDYWKVPVRTFADVKASDRFGKQIENAYEENVIAPDANGRFNPQSIMTRQDAAVILAKAFFLTPTSDTSALNAFSDAGAISDAAKPSVGTLVAAGYLPGRTTNTFAPASAITAAEARAAIAAIAARSTVVVQAMPKQAASYLTVLPDGAGSAGAAGVVDNATIQKLVADRNYAPRRFIHLYTPTPGATIYYTTDGSDPRTSSTRQVYDELQTGHIQELVGERSGARGPQPYRLVKWNTVAVKEGLAVSPVRTFRWNLYRPWDAVYGADVLEAGNFDPSRGPIAPKVTRIYNDSESVRSMSWLIEGPQSAIVFDALQTPWNSADQSQGTLYDKVRSLTSKPLVLIIGHTHGDHQAQAQNFLNAGVPVYANQRGWASLAGALAARENIKQVRNVEDGDTFELGNASAPLRFEVFALPGHDHGLVMIYHRESGYLFSTDHYGCTRIGTADNVAITGTKADLQLSLLMQLDAAYRRDGARVNKLFTGHDEAALPGNHVGLFHQVFQNVVDEQEAATRPTIRSVDPPRARNAMLGNMFTDLYDWAAVRLEGTFGTTPYTYLSAPNAVYSAHPTIDYTQPNAHLKYAVLGNIELTGATLVGGTVSWAAPNPAITASDGSVLVAAVPNTLGNRFNPWVFNYQVRVPAGRGSIGIAPIPLSSKVKQITINGNAILPRTQATVDVANGSVITIVVTAPDGTTTERYTLTVSVI